MGMAFVKPKVEAFKRRLDALGEAGRIQIVDSARLRDAWPSPEELQRHWLEKGGRRTEKEYAELAQRIKSKPGAEVWAYINLKHLSEGLAFVDHDEGWVVWFDLERNCNRSCLQPEEGTKQFLRGKSIDYWRLKDTEL